MPIFRDHNYTLPDGENIVVRQLTPDDALATEEVMAPAWHQAYVETDLLPAEDWRRYVGPHRADWLAERIDAANRALLKEGSQGTLYMGAFTVGTQAKQVGMLKYKGERVGVLLPWVRTDGCIDEIDVHPDVSRRGIGRTMAHAAIMHGLMYHDNLVLDVVQANTRAQRFYVKHLGLEYVGKTSLPDGMPPTMRRERMSGDMQQALGTLSAKNPWLTSAT